MAGGVHRERQRKYRQGATEAKLAGKLEKVKERLQADAANMERPGADLIRHYLDPDRLPAQDRWSRVLASLGQGEYAFIPAACCPSAFRSDLGRGPAGLNLRCGWMVQVWLGTDFRCNNARS
jgi:hypothetical protein